VRFRPAAPAPAIGSLDSPAPSATSSSPDFFRQVSRPLPPLHQQLAAQYADLGHQPNLRRLINDNRNAIIHLGFLSRLPVYEIARRDWRNVTLITTVGFLNGIGWALLLEMKWAHKIWPKAISISGAAGNPLLALASPRLRRRILPRQPPRARRQLYTA
jgi:hypothetical protein